MLRLLGFILLLVVLSTSAYAMQPAQPLYRRFALPEYDARAPKYESGFLILQSKDKAYGLPRAFDVRVTLAEDIHPISSLFARKRHLVIEVFSSDSPNSQTGTVNPDKVEMIPGPALWKSGVSWSLGRTTYENMWTSFERRSITSYSLDVRGDPDKVALLEARLRLGTLEPYFENRMRSASWVMQIIGYETDARAVVAMSQPAGGCQPGALHIQLCERGDEDRPDRETIYFTAPSCWQFPKAAALASDIHLSVPQPDTLTYTAPDCSRKAAPAASVLELARRAAFLDAARKVSADGLDDTITGEVKIPALLWYTARLNFTSL